MTPLRKPQWYLITTTVSIAAPLWIAIPWVTIAFLRAYRDRPEIVFQARDAS